MALTARQLEVLAAIDRLTYQAGAARPRPPTVRELARELARAPSTVVRCLDRLELAGAIVRDGTARGLWVARLALVEAQPAPTGSGEFRRAG